MLKSVMWKPVVLSLLLVLPAISSSAQSSEKQQLIQQLIDKAKASVERFAADPNMTWFRNNVGRAEGLMIVPTSVKGGFILGASGGSGLMVANKGKGVWSYPAFYTMGSVTFGLQIGAEVSEIVLMVMTKRGRDALLTNEFKLGADTSIAVGPVGAGVKAQTADVLAFSRTKGIYGGLNLEGAVVATREDWNRVYYKDKGVRAVDILVSGKARNRAADPLRRAIAKIGK